MTVRQESLDFPPTRIKLIRSLLGMSQQEFAERYNISANSLYFWENGTRSPTEARVLKGLLQAARDAGA